MSRRTLTPDALTVQVLLDLGKTLDRLRTDRGLSLADLAREAGLGENTVSRVMNIRSDVQLSTLALLTDALGAKIVIVPVVPSSSVPPHQI